MIDFYDISEDYIKFLKKYEHKVPNVNYLSNNKFVCGIVLNINGIEYYAPVSHTTEKFRTSLIIKDKKEMYLLVTLLFKKQVNLCYQKVA